MMPNDNLQKVIKLVKSNRTRKQIARELGISIWKARQLIGQAKVLINGSPSVHIEPNDPIFRSEILRKLKNPTTIDKIASDMNTKKDNVENIISDLEARGFVIYKKGSNVSLGKSIENVENIIIFENHFYEKPIEFGVVADMHMASKCERLDVLNLAYDEFARRKINTVLCPGNYVDGEARFNTHELKAHGIADQCQYTIDHWPQREGIKTYYIDGDDHEGWWTQREGIEFGRYLMLEAKSQGRDDLNYLGYMEADIELKAPKGFCVIKIMHAGGGSSYAVSYTSQKQAESFQGGNKPAVCIVGHYHKFDYCYPRAIHMIQPGCCQDQTRFMRKKKLEAHVGFTILSIQQDIKGSIVKFVPEFFPFFDKGYYIDRDGVGDRLKNNG